LGSVGCYFFVVPVLNNLLLSSSLIVNNVYDPELRTFPKWWQGCCRPIHPTHCPRLS
jgi:hypothetical protein